MKCKTLHKKLIFFLEEELDVKEMELVKIHLSECSDCASFIEEMKKTLGVLEAERSPAINPFFYTRLKAKLENQESKQKQVFWRPALVRILQPAVFSILLMVGIYTGIKIGQPASTKQYTATLMQNQEIPYLNEMEGESIETSLME
ncbi:MAG: zf-HC2 domain-containing protein [Mariniphaga sp.]|nr:zf-HC2 domain-containing protein [Mariniphaga sp.]